MLLAADLGATVFRRGYAAIAELNRDTSGLFDGLRAAGVETTLTRPGMVHAFLSPAEARHHLALQRQMADGRYPMPDDVATGEEARLLDDALSPQVRAAYLVEGEGVVDPEAFARGLAEALAAAGSRSTRTPASRGSVRQEGASRRCPPPRARFTAPASSSRPACARRGC